jgi:hypothetical protein
MPHRAYLYPYRKNLPPLIPLNSVGYTYVFVSTISVGDFEIV